MSNTFLPGNLVQARGRTWVVQSGSEDDWLKLRPIGGADDEITELMPQLEREPVELAQFPLPDPTKFGTLYSSAELLYDALRFQLRSGAGPFRSFGSIAVEPRSYQLVPLLMAMRQKTVRLLIADDVGIGKTIEAGLIVREMLDRGEITKFAVLCPPHLVEQWVSELSDRFNIEATALTGSSAQRLERQVPHGHTLSDTFPVLVVSLDYIKSDKHRDYFYAMNFDLIVVDEAHTCVKAGSRDKQLRFDLLHKLASDAFRHMILLTATPHSGNEDGFYSLLSLLDEKFLGLKGREVKSDDPLRQDLAKHFVQRRRKDIEEWKVSGADRMTGFPTRMTTELNYRLTARWDQFFADVQEYCQKVIDRDGKKNQLIWYSVLALFRCVSSSPAAAVQALNNRLKNQEGDSVEEEDFIINDLDNVDEGTDSDVEPALWFDESAELNTLLAEARTLAGSKNDPKIRLLAKHVKELLAEGFNPVIFCRFVATAQYVYDALKEELKKEDDVAIGCVTGELVPGEREERVNDLGEKEKRVLVATDCLSEGINPQDLFTAVVHYDLAWNPTRHEQREGRVDRFGQKAKEVRCSMIYGENNPVDGFILKVILRKSEEIKKDLGVIVPIPEKKEAIDKALLRASLFRDRNGQFNYDDQQMSLFTSEDLGDMNTVWTNALEKMKQQRTVFAQQSIHPEDIYPLWEAQQKALGSHADVEKFSKSACASLGAQLEPLKNNRYRFPLVSLQNKSLVARFEDEGFENNDIIDFDTLHRTSPFINTLSEGVVDEALREESRLISRTAIAQTSEVSAVTRVYLLRLRYQIRIAYRNQTRRYLLSEEIQPVAVTGIRDPKWESSETAQSLLTLSTSGNFTSVVAEKQIRSAMDFIASQKEAIEVFAKERAEQLKTDHQKVKEYSAEGSVTEVAPCLPIDVMGVFVLMPADEE